MSNIIVVKLNDKKTSWFDKISGVNLIGGKRQATIDTDITDIDNIRKALLSGDLELISGTLPEVESRLDDNKDEITQYITGLDDSSLKAINPDVIPYTMNKTTYPSGTRTIDGIVGKRIKLVYIYATSKGTGNADITVTLDNNLVWNGWVDATRDCGQSFMKVKSGNKGGNLVVAISPVPTAYIINWGIIVE